MSIEIVLKGGLGNQMFQYAFGKSISLKTGLNLKLDLSYFSHEKNTDIFLVRDFELGIFEKVREIKSENYNSKWKGLIRKLKYDYFFSRHNIIVENSMKFSASYLDIKQPALLEGYWQDERYFVDYSKEIKNDFTFPSIKKGETGFNELMAINNSEISIGVHIRHGDYLNDLILQHHGICSKGYYLKAIEKILNKFPEASFFFFSDDPDWVNSELLSHVEKGRVISGNSGSNSWKDMFLMSKCNHQIIANSSFSWWAAWLNANELKMVVAPKNWYANNELNSNSADICPKSWLRI